MPQIETERLVIRPLRAEDFDAWQAGYAACAPSKNRFDEGRVDLEGLDRAWFAAKVLQWDALAEEDVAYLFHVFRASDGAAIGHGDIVTHMREDFQYGRVGYTVFNPYWGEGYGTEILQGLLRIGFEQLCFHRLEAHINLDNPASVRVAEKAGMAFECIRPKFIREDGVWTDNRVYVAYNDRWKDPDEEET